MSGFEDLCNSMEKLDSEIFAKLFNEKSAKIITALAGLAEDGAEALSIYLDFILAAVAADNNLSKKEYELLKPMFDMIAGQSTTYEQAVVLFNEVGMKNDKDLSRYVDNVLRIIEPLSPEFRDDLILFSLMVCAVDGKVSESEKRFISQLIAPENIEITPMEAIDSFLTRAGTFTLATICDGQPKMRILGFKTILEGKIYFAVGTFKDVYAQLTANPHCEILAHIEGEFLRWDGCASFKEDEKLENAFKEALPMIYETYKSNNCSLAYFTLEKDTAEIVKIDNTKIKLF
ncbi:MAG: pyridoxamine 5'-phosphate oxidase family protein [archaeon]|nr:pyridoxamine 5'-phosphate oxidase family protein [archaeon]